MRYLLAGLDDMDALFKRAALPMILQDFTDVVRFIDNLKNAVVNLHLSFSPSDFLI